MLFNACFVVSCLRGSTILFSWGCAHFFHLDFLEILDCGRSQTGSHLIPLLIPKIHLHDAQFLSIATPPSSYDKMFNP